MKHALQQIHQAGRSGLRQLTDLVLPPRCYGCGAGIADNGMLCGTCFDALNQITPPACDSCGLPMDSETTGLMPVRICGWCSSRDTPLDHVRAACIYDDGSRPLILAFKHGDRTDMAPALAGWLARAAADIISDDTLILPIPLWRGRLFQRRYNQAAELARHLAVKAHCGWHASLLQRHRDTGNQGGLSFKARHRNVATAFSLKKDHDPDLLTRPILLVDDVYTTGATLEACAKILHKAGASQISAAVLARVDRPGQSDNLQWD